VKTYTVKQGDCLESIAFAHGLFWQTIWDHPDNAELRQKRKDHNVLLPGDVVHIPERKPKVYKVATGGLHRFLRKGVPSKISLQFSNGEQPLSNTPYILEVDDVKFTGKTDSNGMLEHYVKPSAMKAKLTLGSGDAQITREIFIGHLDPADEITGAQQRLNSLGFSCGEVDGKMSPLTSVALKRFQNEHNLEESGELDAPTVSKLKEAFGA
jgi:hypothetical protein